MPTIGLWEVEVLFLQLLAEQLGEAMSTQRLTFTVSLELVHESGPVVARGFLARELGEYVAEMLGPGESFVVVGDGRVAPSDYRMANVEVELTNGVRSETWAAKTTTR